MRENTYFLQMFSDYEPPEPLQSALSQAAIVAADIDPAARSVSVTLENERYIPLRILDQASKDLCQIYALSAVNISPRHASSELCNVELEELMQLFVRENSMARGVLAGAKWSWEGQTLSVQLAANGKDTLTDCLPKVRRNLEERFGTNVQIQITAGESLEGIALFDAMQKLRENMILDLPAVEAQKKKESPQPQNTETIFGKPFKGDPVSMGQVNLDMGSVIVEGRVFAVDHKELKKRNAWVISVDITDHTGSVRIKRFLENNEAKPILDNVNIGAVVKVQGKLVIPSCLVPCQSGRILRREPSGWSCTCIPL